MYAIRSYYEKIRNAQSAAAGPPVRTIEVTHGDGLAGTSFNYGFGTNTDLEWIV